MIGLTAFLVLQAAPLTTNPYFPMTPQSKWVYKLGGQVEGEFIMRSMDPVEDTLRTDGTMESIFHIFSNGELTGKVGYEIKDNALYIVSGANGLPIPPRKVMVFAPDVNWDYYLNASAVISTPAVHVMSSTKDGGMQTWLGTPHQTLICTSEMKLGKGTVLDMFQVSTYAKGIGLVKFVQYGKQGKKKINTTQDLTSFTPGKSKEIKN